MFSSRCWKWMDPHGAFHLSREPTRLRSVSHAGSLRANRLNKHWTAKPPSVGRTVWLVCAVCVFVCMCVLCARVCVCVCLAVAAAKTQMGGMRSPGQWAQGRLHQCYSCPVTWLEATFRTSPASATSLLARESGSGGTTLTHTAEIWCSAALFLPLWLSPTVQTIEST